MRTIAITALLTLTACCTTPAPQQQPEAPVTAICHDGTKSYSKHASGTCSYHGVGCGSG